MVRPIATPQPASNPTSPPQPPPARKPVCPYDPKPRDEEPELTSAQKRRIVEEELERIERQKAAEKAWLAELQVLCRRGRISMHLIVWAVRAYSLGVLLQMAALVGIATDQLFVGTSMMMLCGFCAITGSTLFITGFAFSLVGPPEVRHIGTMGVIVGVLHLILGLLQPGNIALILGMQGLQESSHRHWHELLLVQDILGVATDFVLLADHPARFLHRYNNSLPGILVAAAEFTRLVLFSMLGMAYARGGKHPEHGHLCMTTINRVFWIVLMLASLRLATSSAFDAMNPDEMLAKIGVGVHWALTLGAYLALAVTLLVQSQHLNDTIDVIDHRYWADKRERLDLV